MTKKPTEKPVTETTFKTWTETVFNKEITVLHEKIDSSVGSLNKKIDNVARALLKTQEDVQRIQETMSTKSDSNAILNKLDDISLQIETSNRKTTVHDHRINEFESKLTDHEKRLITLESK